MDGHVGATFVLVTGASPGLGKSTLARRLGDRLAARHPEVVVFPEAMIGDCPAFADVLASFRATGTASRAALVDATQRFAGTYRDGRAIVVQDMLLPYVPSLLAWGFSDAEIAEVFAEIDAACVGIRLVQLHLDGSPARSVPRAVEREDPSWLDWMLTKVSRYADVASPVTDLPSLVAYFEGARRRTRRLLARAPWPVTVLDADRGPEHVLEEAEAALDTSRCSPPDGAT